MKPPAKVSPAPVLTESEFRFEFREPASLPNPMLAFSVMACGYRADDGTETRIIDNINRSVLAGQRIGILGANGQGKSTLVKTIAHQLQPINGVMTEGKGLVVGYFAPLPPSTPAPASSAPVHAAARPPRRRGGRLLSARGGAARSWARLRLGGRRQRRGGCLHRLERAGHRWQNS